MWFWILSQHVYVPSVKIYFESPSLVLPKGQCFTEEVIIVAHRRWNVLWLIRNGWDLMVSRFRDFFFWRYCWSVFPFGPWS